MLLFAAGYAFVQFHGLVLHLGPWTQALVNGVATLVYDTSHQSETTVVLLRDDDLHELELAAPIPLSAHADVLDAIAHLGPSKVFIDFAFIDERPQTEVKALADRMQAMCESGIEVFIADPTSSDAHPRLLAGLRASGQGCPRRVSPAIARPEGVSGILVYPSVDPSFQAGSEASAGPLPSAAFALAGMAPHRSAQSSALEKAERHDTSAMEILWPAKKSSLNEQWMDCGRPGLLQTLGEVAHHGPLALRFNCPYTPTLGVAHVLRSSGDPDVIDAIKGRTVLYGGGIAYSGDRVSSPVFSEMPGVFLHAMALDNLRAFGSDYKRARSADRSALYFQLLALAGIAAVLVLTPRSHAKPASREEAWNSARLTLLSWLAMAVATAVTYFMAGFHVAVAVAVVAYVAYRIVVNHDRGLLIVAVLGVAASVVSYEYFNLGPRHLIAYLVFFEVARHVQHLLSERAETWSQIPCTQGGPSLPASWPRRGFENLMDIIGSVFRDSSASKLHGPATQVAAQDEAAPRRSD